VIASRPAARPTGPANVFLLEPKADLRHALEELLDAQGYLVVACDSLPDLLRRAAASRCDLALIAWQGMRGLLADANRQDLQQLARRLPIVIMVPRSWFRVLQPSDLAVRGLLGRPFDADELLDCVARNTDVTALHG
jgi:DNA-binding response OmpR family regulator